MKHSAKMLAVLMMNVLAFSGCAKDNSVSAVPESDISTASNINDEEYEKRAVVYLPFGYDSEQ